jgi:hypothetical protein
MPYHVKIKNRRDDLILPDATGQRLYDRWRDGSLPERVEVSQGLVVLATHLERVEYQRERVYPKVDTSDLAPEQRSRNLKRLAKMREALWGKTTTQGSGHYTEAHRLARCTCFRPEDWPTVTN